MSLQLERAHPTSEELARVVSSTPEINQNVQYTTMYRLVLCTVPEPSPRRIAKCQSATMENKNKQEEGLVPLQLSLGSRLLLDSLLVELIQKGTV